MANLTRAHNELFRRTADECFPSLAALMAHCRSERERSTDRWRPPSSLAPVGYGTLALDLGEGSGPYKLNDWSFAQLSGIAGVSKDTINRLVEGLVAQRDARKDGYAKVVRKAMETKLGDDAEEVLKVLNRNGISRTLAKRAGDRRAAGTLHDLRARRCADADRR